MNGEDLPDGFPNKQVPMSPSTSLAICRNEELGMLMLIDHLEEMALRDPAGRPKVPVIPFQALGFSPLGHFRKFYRQTTTYGVKTLHTSPKGE